MSISKNLKVIRKAWKDSQKSFGDRFEVTNTAVSKWELGENEPSLWILIELEDLTGIPARRLYREEIAPEEVHPVPGQHANAPVAPEGESRMKEKIADLVMELDEVGRQKVKVVELVQSLIGFLERDMDESVYAEEKKAYLEKMAAILGGQ